MEILNVPEVADELRISETAVYRLIHAGHLKAVNAGVRRRVVSREELDDVHPRRRCQRGRVVTATSATAGAPSDPPASAVASSPSPPAPRRSSPHWQDWHAHDPDAAIEYANTPRDPGSSSPTPPRLLAAPPSGRGGVWDRIARCESGGRWDHPPVTNSHRHLLGWPDDRASLVARLRRPRVRPVPVSSLEGRSDHSG